MGGAEQTPDDDKLQTKGRKDNAARPVNPEADEGGAERYPPVRQDDAVDTRAEDRSFTGSVESDEPARETDRDPSVNQGFMGPRGDPAEGKR